MGRQYRRADAGDLDWVDANAAARILREMRVAIEGSDFEARLAALEQTLAGRPKLNGHARPARPGEART